MVILETSLDLDAVKSEVSSIIKDTRGLPHSSEEYLDNQTLNSRNSNVPDGTKVKFYLDQARKRNTDEDVTSHMDPLAFRIKAYRTISTGVFSSHTHYAHFFFWDLSRIRILAQGNELSIAGRPQTVEMWISICSESHSSVTDFRDEVRKKIEEQI